MSLAAANLLADIAAGLTEEAQRHKVAANYHKRHRLKTLRLLDHVEELASQLGIRLSVEGGDHGSPPDPHGP